MRKTQSIVHEGYGKVVLFLCLMLATLQSGRACPELIEGACGQIPVATEPNSAVVQEEYYGNDQGMPAMLDFTGYGCVNCRKMEAAVWTDKQVSDLMNNEYVLITLYVDDKTPLAPRQVTRTERKCKCLACP